MILKNNLLYGKIEFIRALITYEAKDAKNLNKAFHEVVEDYLLFCEQNKIEPERPFKGSLNVRIGEQRHRKAWEIATSLGKNLNEYITWALDESFKNSQQATPSKLKKGSKNLKKNVNQLNLKEFAKLSQTEQSPIATLHSL